MRLRFAIPALALLAAALPASLNAQPITPAEVAKIDAIVAQSLSRTGVPSASIAIVRGGEIVFSKAYGKQSETIRTARIDAPYQIASVSKQFTAAALLLLEDQGKLSLDDKVSQYLAGISDGDKITLRQLLNHTSGLQDYWPQDYSFAAMATPTTPQGIVDRWAKKPLDYVPGTQWQYSNTGYVVAGMIIEKVAGMPMLDYLQKNVFKPLEMKVISQDAAIGPNYPQGYQRFALGPVRVEKPAAPGWLFAAGELSMSATDLAKWNIARMNRSLLPADDWTAQETPTKLADGSATNYGLGVTVGTANGHRFVEHSGEAVGFLSENIVFPDDKVAITVLVNSDFSNAFTAIAGQVTDLILPPAPVDTTEATKTASARKLFDMLRTGTLDRKLMTENANYYFTDIALGDYRQSLTALGEPKSFEAVRKPRARGGFINRNYRVVFDGQTLNIITYSEPGENGRFEQFLVMPTQ
ncbi:MULTISPECIES: serine hydrolase [unclassified Sphingomonas]|uniref:serine hydrolase domain-containing protein n=1 Tax=unclassified Sphingomonas TaxID=196159 RepID=UPI000BC3A352|nr:MAG: serine hydrolase [Sphingomonas sp. 12-62-6]OYX37093.1 MAG: serine hydrolase [Sphingomonas sp. 32-62-10]